MSVCYESFKDFYRMEECIEKNLFSKTEDLKQITYLLGPVGGGKSAFAEEKPRLLTK